MKMKNLIAYAMLALGAVAAPFAAMAETTGDIFDLIPLSGSCTPDNALKSGQKFQFILRLLARDYEADQKGEWAIVHVGIGSEELDKLYPPRVGIVVSGKMRYADIVAHGPNPEKGSLYTDLRCEYMVEPGDFALPVKLALAGSTEERPLIPLIDSTDASAGYFLQNVAGIDLVSPKWQFMSVDVTGGVKTTNVCSFVWCSDEAKNNVKSQWPSGRTPVTDVDMSKASFFVKSIDFDSDNPAYPSETPYWRTVHETTTETVPSPTIETIGVSSTNSAPVASTKFYVWSEDDSVVYMDGANVTTRMLHPTADGVLEVPHKVYEFDLVTGVPKYPIVFRGAEGAHGKSTTLVLSATPDYTRNAAKTTVMTNFLSRPVFVDEPPKPNIKVTWDAAATQTLYPETVPAFTNDLSEVSEQGIPLYITLSEPFGVETKLHLKAKIADDASDDWSFVYTNTLVGVLSRERQSFTVPPVETNITFAAAEKQLTFWIYPVGGIPKTRNPGVKFTVEFDKDTPEEIRTKYENEGGGTLRFYDPKPAIVSPTASDSFAFTGGSCTIPVVVMDSYRDLSEPRVFTVQAIAGGIVLCTSNAVPFRSGESTAMVLDSSVLQRIQGPEAKEMRLQVKVTDPLNQTATSDTMTLSIPAKEKTPTVSAALYDTSGTGEPHDGNEFDEGQVAYVRFTLEPEASERSLHAYLVPRNWASSNLVMIAEDVRNKGILIPAGKTDSSAAAALTLLDGTALTDGSSGQIEFDIVLKDDDGNVDTAYEPPSPALTLTVRNVPTTYEDKALYVNGSPEPTPNGATNELEIASGTAQSFVASYSDVSQVDLTNGIVTIWCFTDGKKANTYKYAAVTSTTDSVECKHSFTTVNADQKVMWIPVDKDTLKSLLSGGNLASDGLKTLWPSLVKVTPAYTITVHVGDAPHIILGEEEMRFPETSKDARVKVSLSEPYEDGPVYLKLKLTSFDPTNPNRGNATFPGNVSEYVLEIKQDALEPARTLDYNKGLGFDYESLDGTAVSAEDGFYLEVEAYTEPTCKPDERLAKYAKAEGYVYVENRPPEAFPREPANNPTNTTLAVNEEFTLTWSASDVTNDLQGVAKGGKGLACRWYIDDNLQNDKTVYVTDTADRTTTLKFTSDGFHEVRLEVEDKDGEAVDGKASRRWFYYIAPTKAVEVTPVGPSMVTKTKYSTAAGLGQGRVWANGIKGSAEGFAQTWTYNIKATEAEVHAYGYASSNTVYRDNGKLGRDNRDLAIDEEGYSFSGTPDESRCYLIDGVYDSYFYRWALLSGESGGVSEPGYGPIQPQVSPTVDVSETITLDPYEEKKASYAKRRVEAIFSREMYESDNMGDINQDGIPDLYVSLYKFGSADEKGGSEADDLKKLDAYNADLDSSDQANPDFLPYVEVSQYSVLIPELPSTWTEEGVPFDALTEIRGYHFGLNDATAQKTVDGVNNPAVIRNAKPDRVYGVWDDAEGRWTYDPAQCTISELEFLAWQDAGCPAVEKWSPERPTSPILSDTDGDGFSDGYEYFMWYRAHVGYMDGTVHRYLTGERFDPENPSMGRLITSEEIARLFDPLSKSGDMSESLTRDTDNDGLPDLLEFLLGTNPVHWDTDGDGLPDGYEVAMNGGTETEAGSADGITGQGEAEDAAKTVFDPCGRNIGVDEAMYNGDNDAMAYARASRMPEPIYGFRQPDGTIAYYWIPGATNVVSTNAIDCWTFEQTTVATNRQTGAEYAVTNLYLTTGRPSIAAVGDEWVLTETLTEDRCWLGGNVSTNEGEVVLIRTAPQYLARGLRVNGEAVESGYHEVTYGGHEGGAIHRVFKYGPRVYGPEQPYGHWVCGAEVVRPRGSEIVATLEEPVFLIHTHVYQGVEAGEGARTAWNPSSGWGDGSPYTQLDEFLVCFYHYLDNQPESAEGGKAMDITPTRKRTWPMIWSDYCTDPSTADTDGDGIPDGWELYTFGGPKAYNMLTGERLRNYGPHSENSAKNAAAGFVSDWHGSTCSLYYGPYCKSIVDSYCVTHPFWSNKKSPTDPWVEDTDGDGIPDAEEAGLFAYLAETPAWKDKVPSYPDAIPGPGAGGGLDPLSWDTDMDGLPDPWERQYGTDTMGHNETFGYDAEESEGHKAQNCWCRLNDYGEMVPTVDGTVADAGEDYDHDGLLNWQEYLVSAMRCWRYDDTISSWRNLAFLGVIDFSSEWLTERLINGGVFKVDGETKCAGIDGWMVEYDGQYDGYNPQIQVSGMYDIGASWFSLCTNEFDQAKGRWYMFYDGVYHDLKEGGVKWTVPGMPQQLCNRFTWRAFTLGSRNPGVFFSDPGGMSGYWFGDAEIGDYLVAPNRYPGTDPNDFDTDDDGMDDYWELFHGLNPLLGRSGGYREASRPAVDCVYEAYAYDRSGSLITDPETGKVRNFASAEKNYWTWLDKIEPNSVHFAAPQRKRTRKGKGEEGESNPYDFGRFPWLNGLPGADPDGDNIRNQQEGIFAQVQANSTYLHTDPSPLWMTDKSYADSLTHRYYQLPDIKGFTDANCPGDGFTDAFGQEHKWSDFPGYSYDPMNGLTLPGYSFSEWSVPNPNREEAGNLATVTVSGFGWDFEENEGYDSDHDYLSDSEEQQGRTKNASDAQDTDDPLRRQAMWFGGEANKSVLQTPPEIDRLPPNDTVPSGNDQPYLYFTVECWAKPEGRVNRDQVLVERSIWTGSANPADDRLLRKNFQIGIHGSDAGAIWYAKYDSTGTDDQKPIEISDGPAVATNRWTHIAATFDGENLKLYVDGVCLRTLATKAQPEHGVAAIATEFDGTFRKGSLFYRNRAFTVGASICKAPMLNISYSYADWTHYNQYYRGYIDEVRIWDGARSATEILANYRKRFTAADALENRTTVYNAWNLGYTREAVTTGILPAELKLCWNFDHLPGATEPGWVERQPAGFTTPEDTVDGKAIWSRPKDWVEPWWDGVALKSGVYDDPAWVPWIVDMVHHLPNYDLTTLDSFYWSEDFVGNTSVGNWAANYFGGNADGLAAYTKFAFPRTHETPVRWTQVSFKKGPPYTISDRYRMICGLCAADDPSGSEMMKRYAFTLRHALREGFDLLPLGGAYPKRISAAEGGMWDENGAADAWAQTGNGTDPLVDKTDKGVPDWWTEYYLQNHPELDPDTVIRWDTVIDYNGVAMPAWQAYIRDLADGLLPDGTIHPEFRDDRDLNKNGLPDWWEDFWKLTNRDADADPDNDGLSTYSEYLAVEGAYPYGVTNGFPQLNPNLTYSTTKKVTDYFLSGPTNDMPAGGKHIYANEYLGEIFTDHDFMEDWWERLYARTYADPMKYDPLNDKDEDGWSNFAECRAALWGGFFSADLIDSWTGSQSDQHVVNYPEPTIGVRVTYHGDRDISGQQLVIRTISGQSPRVDATFVIPASLDSQTRYIGPFQGDSVMRGQLSPGHLNANSVVFERAKNDMNRTFFWNWNWYDEQQIGHPTVVSGTFEDYRYYFARYPHIELEGGDLIWEAFAIAVETMPGTADLMFVNGNRIGTLNSVTGEYEIDFNKFDQNVAEYVFRASYTSRVGHEWPQTVYVSDTKELASGTGTGVAGNGRVKEGRNTIEAFMDMNGDGKLDEGEPLGVARNVQIGWHKVPEVVIELKDESPIMPVVRVDGSTAGGGKGGDEASGAGEEELTRRIVVYRDQINGQAVPDRLLAAATVVMDDHPYVTEADVSKASQPDLDWTWLLKDAERHGMGIVNSARYRVEQVATLDDGTTTNVVLKMFVKTFAESRPTASAVAPIDNEPVYTAAPTFSFALSDTTATGYRLQVRRAGDSQLVYDSGIAVLPGRTGSTVGAPVCAVTPYLYVDNPVYSGVTTNRAVFADGSNYQWRVALYNAKYKTASDAEDSTDWSVWAKFQMDVANANRYPQVPTGYGVIPLAVRYFGPGNPGTSNLVVEAYENADFRGQPLAQMRLKDAGDLRNRDMIDRANLTLRGIRPGTVYLRAFYDQNDNGTRDTWEAWGYANMVGKGLKAIYNPEGYEVTASAYDWTSGARGKAERVIFIEDCDRNSNEIPDCLEPEKFPDNAENSEEKDEPISWWEWAEADPEDAADGDVMAYFNDTMRLVTLVSNDVYRTYLQSLDEPEPVAGNAAPTNGLYTYYQYTAATNGLGTNVTVSLKGWRVYEKPTLVPVLLVHRQVYDKFGYDMETAVPGGTVNTRPFTAYDKYRTLYYLEQTGRVTESRPEGFASFADYVMTSGDVRLFEKWTLKPGVIDMDHDGIADGWELYVDGNPLDFSDRESDDDDDGLKLWQEYNFGAEATDPKNKYSLYEALAAKGWLLPGTRKFTDAEVKKFGLSLEDADGDEDIDLISNLDEMRAYYFDPVSLADLDYRNAWSDGETPDYFRACTNSTGSATKYLGELFNGAEFIEPDMRQLLGLDETAMAGTRDVQLSGWSGWSIVRNIKYSDVDPEDLTEAEKLDLVLKYMAIEHPGRFEGSTLDDVIDFLVKRMDDRNVVYLDNLEKIDDVLAYIGGFEGTKEERVANGLRIVGAKVKEANANGDLVLPEPEVRLVIRYAGNVSQAIVVEAYQVSSAYPEYGEQLTAKWTANATFDAGISKPVLTLTEGTLKQGPARFVAYIDVDGDGKFSAGDTSGSATAEVGHLGCDLEIALGEANPALPPLRLSDGTNTYSTLALVRSEINGKPYFPNDRGVFIVQFPNNAAREALYPDEYDTGSYIGIDSTLSSLENADEIETVTYEVLRLRADEVAGLSVTNLNHWIFVTNGVTNVVSQTVNETVTFRYSLERDVAASIACAGSTADDFTFTFTVPTDTMNTKFWLNVQTNGAAAATLLGGDKGFILNDIRDGVVVLDKYWFKANHVTIPTGRTKFGVVLGNDKFGKPSPVVCKMAETVINEGASFEGKLAVKVRHPTATLDAKLTVAAYEKADLVNPVSVTNNCTAGETVELKGLRPGVAYYVAAWYVNDPDDGRGPKAVRMPYDTWGYLTMLGEEPNGFDAKAVKAELAPSVTNLVFLQDTDWNDNNVIDREEDFRANNGDYKRSVEPIYGFEIDDVEESEVFSDAKENDVFAYAEVPFYCVMTEIGGAETWFAVTDLASETVSDKVTPGIPVGTSLSNLTSLAATYYYDFGKSNPKRLALGTNITWTGGEKVMRAAEEKVLILVHAQVYDRFGFNPNTANGRIDRSAWVNTRAFTSVDKAYVTNYLANICGVADPTKALPIDYPDSDKVANGRGDGMPDGWELYVMFGTNGTHAVAGVAEMPISPWNYDDRGGDPDKDDVTNLHEYDGGAEPTDPWNAYSMYENLAKMGLLLPGTEKFTDKVAQGHKFGVTPATANEDGDLDLISNIQEMTAYYRDPTALADLSVTNAWSDGTTPDYFRLCGSKYLGELFNGAEFIEPDVRKVMGLGTLVRSGTRDYGTSGWDAWSTARYSILNAEQSLNIEGVVSDELMLLIRYWNVIRPGEFTGTTVSNAMEFFHTTWEGGLRLIDDDGNVVIEAKKPASVSGWGTIHDADAAQTTTQVVAFFGGQKKMEEVIARNKKDLTADQIVAPEPTVNLVLKYTGNGSYNIVLEAYQTSSAYPEYGEQLTAQWAVPVKFDSGVAKINEIRTPGLGSLKQGPARFVAYIDVDGDGTFSAADTFGTADAEVGWAGLDLEIRMGDPCKALPAFAFGDGTNPVSQVKFVRTKINGQPIVYDGRDEEHPQGPHTVYKRVYENNIQRATIFPDDYVLGNVEKNYIGLDRYLENYRGVDSVTYEVLVGPGPFTISNLTEFAALVAKTNSAGKTVYATNTVHTGAANQTFTVNYSRIRDIAQVIAMADQLQSTAEISFTVPTDTPATKFWLSVDGVTYPNVGTKIGSKTFTGESGFLIPPDAQGVVTIKLADYIGTTLSVGPAHTVKIALGNDRFQRPTNAADWSQPATIKVNADPAWNGRILVETHNEHLAAVGDWDWGKVVVAAYDTPDLVNPVSLAKGVAGNGMVTLQDLRKDQKYYLAAWYVKDAADGRGGSLRIRQPYDTWGYLTALGHDANGFTVVAASAQGIETGIGLVTNRIYLQDTDWNGNFKADRLEDFMAINGFTPVGGGAISYVDDFDLNGLPDAWEEAQEEEDDDGRTTSDDVMAYFEVEDMTYVALGKDGGETNWIWCAVLDARDPATGYRLTDGTVKLQTPANEIANLYSVYSYYGTYDQMLTRDMRRWEGIGTNVSYSADWKAQAVRVGKAKFVHAQVYALFGYETDTCVPGSTHHTKAFTATDKYLVCRYLQNIGVADVDESLMSTNIAYQWIWTLKDKVIDSDRDGVADGWELYTMFGPNGYSFRFGADGFTASSLTNSVSAKIISPFTTEDGMAPAPGKDSRLKLVEEYDDGHFPTDPWHLDTDGDGVTDYYAYQYVLKGDDSGEDWDGDGLSNYAEYLISEVFRFAKISSRNPKTDGSCVDYFRKMGELYLGEIFTDHDQVDDVWEAEHPEFDANRYVFDPYKDVDGNGWDNFSEYHAYASGHSMNTVVGYQTNEVTDASGQTVRQVIPIIAYDGHPTPAIELTLKFDRALFAAGTSNATVRVEAYKGLVAPDAVWTVVLPAADLGNGCTKVTLRVADAGLIRQGSNTFICYVTDGVTYTPGAPFGVVRDVDVGWDGAKAEVGLTKTSAITPRIDLWTDESDRVATLYSATGGYPLGDPLYVDIHGTNDEARAAIEQAFSNRVSAASPEAGKSMRVRVVRYGIDNKFSYVAGVGSPDSLFNQVVTLDKSFDDSGRPFLCEADFLGEGEFDIDWNTLSGTDFTRGAVVNEVGQPLGTDRTGPKGSGLVVSNMTYLVVIGDGADDFRDSDDTNTVVSALTTMVTRRFEVVRHLPVAENVEGIVHGARPTFRWSIPDEEMWAKAYGSSYTAFKLQILSEDGRTVVYDSGVRRAPPQDKDGFFTWTADAFVGDRTALGQIFGAAGQWKWRVAMYNAKFKPQAKDSRELWSNEPAFATAAGTQQETDDHGYSSVDVSVKYTGPALVLSHAGFVRVQAFETADFSGTPAAQMSITNLNSVKDATDIRKNGTFIGLKSGTYYVRAYIDTNQNGVKDDWESWGCAKEPVEVKLNQLAPITGLYIEDADTDQDWLPDAWEMVKYGNLATKGADIDPTGKIVLKTEVYEALQTGTANISRFLSGASLTFFQNIGNVSLALGLDDVTETSIAEIRAMVEKNIDPDSVKITSLTVDPGNGTNGKVVLTVAAKATDSIAGYLLAPVYELPKSTDVTINIYRKDNLATAEWTLVKTVSRTIESTLEARVEVPIEGVDFNSGFYKVEIVK